MQPAEFIKALDLPHSIAALESSFTVKNTQNLGCVDWMSMRDSIGQDRFRSYVRMRRLMRDAMGRDLDGAVR